MLGGVSVYIISIERERERKKEGGAEGGRSGVLILLLLTYADVC